MALSDEFLDRLLQSNDIVTAFQRVATLKKSGSDFVCLCPFHSEKTASCHISQVKQRFYCHGCHAGGTVITFTELTENLDYMSAVRTLAERSGIPMPDEDDEQGRQLLQKRRRVYEMNRAAGRFFIDRLRSPEGAEGYAFLRNRGLTDETIKKYGLGVAPDSWNMLKYHMNGLGYGDDELVEASLLKRNEKGNVYDFFRDRAMFPIRSKSGEVIAFSGRQIKDEGFGGKYVNSSETAVYRKGENLFSINFANGSKKNYAILCEGNIDAVMLNQAGFDNAVAILGTALTPAQARLLRYSFEEAVLAYDSDAAGEKATVKAIGILGREGVTARVLELGDMNDPDDYIRKYGAESFERLVERSGSAISFELDKLKKSVDMETPHGRAEYLKKGVALLSQVENLYERTVYGSDLAKACEVTTVAVNDAIEAAVKNKSRYAQRDEKRGLIRGTNSELTASERAEQGIIAYLFHSPDKLPVILKKLSPGDFPTDFHRKLFETLVIRLKEGQSIGIASLGGEFSAVEVGRIERIKMENAELAFTDARLSHLINVLVELKSNQSQKSFEEMTDEELKEYTKLQNEKKTVKI